ncbi:hypothetical protein UFOVP1131_9 [uncultured Caudovirales phage]|uniref:Uncharacterized protein n=3 Tax=uncultured Caudovirales phage TaxID=2100421 RepID=A0A6J5R6W7_9CAUD|nr:hypothetical protein UFOVP966_23 [uncultured Caudovirales phage]CAB4184491.1 hypothetical protein UFOVP1131_9 [uncultured Caudovirales phage]CAB4192659.1 hypothetical protein UFOVP1245_53 [uncultured Caudovirales phage]
MEALWSGVEVALRDAKGIAFDTCHKIYVLMDDEQMDLMKEYGYDPLISSGEMQPDQMLQVVRQWYSMSCMLRFVNAVRTNHDDPNAGFVDLIPQGVDGDDEQ